MISFVNGFLCTCSCDVSKAKRGVDPHQQTDGAQNPNKPNAPKNGMVTDSDPAVVLGGLLKDASATAVTSAQAVAPLAPLNADTQSQSINLLV
jgi:hypothetical protein